MTFFEQKERDCVVDMFQVGPFVDPGLGAWFGEGAREGEAIDLFYWNAC